MCQSFDEPDKFMGLFDDDCAVEAAKASETGFLETGSGSARILWKESGTGLKWGIVLFPVGQPQLTALAVCGVR